MATKKKVEKVTKKPVAKKKKVEKKKVATKKRATKKKDESPEEVALSEAERYSLLYPEAKVANAVLAIRLKTKEYKEQINALEQKLQQEINLLNLEKEAAVNEMKAAKDQIQEKYKMNFTEYTFREETGIFTKLNLD